MEKCDICGRELTRKHKLRGYTLCSKHMHQLFNYGKFLDNNPRTQNDLNEYRIEDDKTIFDLYDGNTSEKIDEFIIDTEDLSLVKYHKWRKSTGNHIVTGLPYKGTQRDLSWVVLGLDNRDEKNKGIVVDHINCNPRDNRKSNLRICTQGDNVFNKSFMSTNTSGFIGVNYQTDRDRYDPEIRYKQKRCHLGYVKSLKEAVYKRYIAEKFLFKEFANKEELQRKYEFTKDLPEERKKELEKITLDKITDKFFGNQLCRVC